METHKRFWNVPVTETLDNTLEEAVSQDMHSTKSDLIREAVREKLERMGFTYKKKETDTHA